MFAKSLSEKISKNKGIIASIHPGWARTGIINTQKLGIVLKCTVLLFTPFLHLITKSA